MDRCPHGLETRQCSECCDAPAELRPPLAHAAIGSLHWVGRKDIPSLHAVWRWWPEAGCGYWVDDLGGRREPNIEGAIYCYLGPADWSEILALEAALDRANEVCRQTQEIADLRGQEIAQLRGQLQMLFHRAAATPAVSRETSSGNEHSALFSAIAKHKET